MFDLSGRTALVTGASGGIGGAIAEALHQQGASVILAGRRQAPLDALKDKLGERASVLVGDLTDPAAMATLGEVAAATDILVNNAGITRDQLAMRMKDEDWQAVIDTNLGAAFRLTRALLKTMMKRRFGRIVNITSVVGVTGNPGQTNYAAAKAGLIGMSKALAQEVASRNITVNCVAPGFIETPMTDALDEKQREAILTRVPVGRLGQSSEIAAAVAYLASDEAAYVTGQTLHVNGGMAMIQDPAGTVIVFGFGTGSHATLASGIDGRPRLRLVKAARVGYMPRRKGGTIRFNRLTGRSLMEPAVCIHPAVERGTPAIATAVGLASNTGSATHSRSRK